MLAIEEEIFQTSIARGVLVVKGTWFRAEAIADKDASVLKDDGAASAEQPRDMFFRTTFAAVDEEKVTEAICRFGDALREVFGLQDLD